METSSPSPAPPTSTVLAGERVAFTGTLASMTHRRAAELVELHGGTPVQHVGQQTTLLVIGEEGWPLEPDGQPSQKLVQAQAQQQRGSPLRMLSESEWLNVLGLEPSRPAPQWYTPAMLSQVLNVSVGDIRRWERWGLIHPVRRVMRLPYFDYSEVAAARRLAQLIDSGISPQKLQASLKGLQSVLPGIEQPLAQLELFVQGSRVLARHGTGWIESRTGQRVLKFDDDVPAIEEPSSADVLPFSAERTTDTAHWSADDWFREGCRLADDGELGAAVEAYRLALIDQPTHADWHFHLADVLYRQGNRGGAIERYHMAVEHDHDFIEAWTQLGCVLAESGEQASAKDAFRVALDRHPDYPDARFHLAQLLDRLDESAAAREHWQRYLEFDQHGPWADIARQRLSQ